MILAKLRNTARVSEGPGGGCVGVRLVKNQKLSKVKAELPSLIRGRTGTDETSKSEL